MRKLTDADLDKIIGSTVTGYYVEAAKIKQGPFADSDHYGFLLGKNAKGEYVTWQFHLLDDDSIYAYWGHFISSREEALRDFNARSIDEVLQWFDVTITETLELTVRVEAHSKQEAEQVVANDWRDQEFVLGPENFAGVEFEVKPAEQ